MEIDTFTVIAQIVNFLILVYLLKRFLYRPVLEAMDRREAGIAQRLQQAADQSAIAAQEAEAFRAKSDALDAQREGLLRDMRHEVEARRDAMLESLRDDVADTGRRWREQVERERQSFLRELRQQLSAQVCHLSREALLQLANAELETQMARVFLHRLPGLPEEDRQQFREAADRHETLSLVSALPLAEDLQTELATAVQATLDLPHPPEFKEDSQLICGLELRAPGYQVGWSLAEHLDDVEANLRAHLASATLESPHAG